MTTATDWIVGIVIGLPLPFVVRRALGPVRALDPMLLFGSTFVAIRGVISVAELLVDGKTDPIWIFAVLGVAYFVRARIRIIDSATGGTTDA